MRVAIASCLAAFAAASAVHAQEYVRDVKIPKGKVKVVMTALATDGPPSGPARSPKVGVAPFGGMTGDVGTYVALALDEGGKVRVTTPAKMTEAGATLGMAFDTMTRSEVAETVVKLCRGKTLDYVLMSGATQQNMKMDPTVMLFGLGRMRNQSTQDLRLYDCKSSKSVWSHRTMFEGSQGVMTSALSGNMSGGMFGPDASRAIGGVIAEKLVSDLRW